MVLSENISSIGGFSSTESPQEHARVFLSHDVGKAQGEEGITAVFFNEVEVAVAEHDAVTRQGL